MNTSKTHEVRVTGDAMARWVALWAINKSMFFAIMPLCDDVWEISVREENKELLANFISCMEVRDQPPAVLHREFISTIVRDPDNEKKKLR